MYLVVAIDKYHDINYRVTLDASSMQLKKENVFIIELDAANM